MPHTKSESSSLISELASRLEELVAAARKEGHDEALADLGRLVGGGAVSVAKRRGPGRPEGSRNKPRAGAKARKANGVRKASGTRKARKNGWAGLTPAQRLARVNAIRKGRGLPPKTES